MQQEHENTKLELAQSQQESDELWAEKEAKDKQILELHKKHEEKNQELQTVRGECDALQTQHKLLMKKEQDRNEAMKKRHESRRTAPTQTQDSATAA